MRLAFPSLWTSGSSGRWLAASIRETLHARFATKWNSAPLASVRRIVRGVRSRQRGLLHPRAAVSGPDLDLDGTRRWSRRRRWVEHVCRPPPLDRLGGGGVPSTVAGKRRQQLEQRLEVDVRMV